MAGVVMHVNEHLFENLPYQGRLQLQRRFDDHTLKFSWLVIELIFLAAINNKFAGGKIMCRSQPEWQFLTR